MVSNVKKLDVVNKVKTGFDKDMDRIRDTSKVLKNVKEVKVK